jgi:hypothetical protein
MALVYFNGEPATAVLRIGTDIVPSGSYIQLAAGIYSYFVEAIGFISRTGELTIEEGFIYQLDVVLKAPVSLPDWLIAMGGMASIMGLVLSLSSLKRFK